MPTIESLEKPLEDVFITQAPPLSNNTKRALVQYLPWVSLALGIVTAYALYILWHWAHLVNNYIAYTNSLNAAYGGPVVTSDRFTFGVWLGIAILAVEAVLYLAAFLTTRNRKKSGWDLIFYALLLNFVYGVAILFTDYGSLGNFIWAAIGSGVGLYLLFQIRDTYLRRAKSRTENASSSSSKAKSKKA